MTKVWESPIYFVKQDVEIFAFFVFEKQTLQFSQPGNAKTQQESNPASKMAIVNAKLLATVPRIE
jgi:hypothetical protein